MGIINTFFTWRGSRQGKRNVRVNQRILRENRVQTALLGRTHFPEDPAVGERTVAPAVQEWWRTRTPWTTRFTEDPDREPRWWAVWLAVTVFCAVAHPGSLLISLPAGVYLFLCRQSAARERQRRIAKGLSQRADDATAPILVPTGRHHR